MFDENSIGINPEASQGLYDAAVNVRNFWRVTSLRQLLAAHPAVVEDLDDLTEQLEEALAKANQVPLSEHEVFLAGVKDGIDQQPFESGMTYHEDELNEAYDRGVNFGQQLRSNPDEPALDMRKPLPAAPVQRIVISQLQTESDVEGEYKGIYMAQVRKIENVFMPSLRGSGSAWLDPIESPTPCVMINGRWHQAFHRKNPNDMMSSYWEVIVQREDPLPAPLQEQPCELTDTQELVMAARDLLGALVMSKHMFVKDIPVMFMEKLHKALPPAPTGEE